MTTLKERFAEKFPFKEERISGFTYLTVPPKPSDLLAFFQQELLALAEEVEDIIVGPEVWKKMKSNEQFETIGGNAGTRRAAALIRSKADELV